MEMTIIKPRAARLSRVACHDSRLRRSTSNQEGFQTNTEIEVPFHIFVNELELIRSTEDVHTVSIDLDLPVRTVRESRAIRDQDTGRRFETDRYAWRVGR